MLYTSQTSNTQHIEKWKTISGQTYTQDRFPKTFSEDDIRLHTGHYADVPEGFFTRTKLPVVTPENVEEWFDKASKTTQELHMQVFMSGSRRLTCLCLTAGLDVGFPIDDRYGWDLRNTQHQGILDRITSKLDFYAPSSLAWHSTSDRLESK